MLCDHTQIFAVVERRNYVTNFYYFLIYYVVIYMGNAIYSTFIPVYLYSSGFSQPQIGTLLSLGPFVAILAQPWWGTVGDRARTKNAVLLLLITGTAISILLFPLFISFSYLLVMICVFTFFQTSIFSLSDAITLEELDKQQRWSFGTVRMGGTFGFALMSILFGFAANKHLSSMFWVYAGVMGIAFLLVLQFPKVQGHQLAGQSVRIWSLFQHRKLTLYLSFSFILQVTLGYYYAFFPIYFKEMGGDNVLLGWSMVISSLSEIPFLIYSGRLLKRVPVPYILLGAACAMALRWFLFANVHIPVWVLLIQMLHGLIFIVLTVTMATYINQEVPKELKASGQMLNGLINLGAARIIGSFFGGLASSAFGMRNVFFYNGLIVIVCIVVFGAIFLQQANRAKSVQT
jgi:PPP family 3-phenylpropionic acid transporter